MARPTLIVFVRAPAVGRGKSRLAKDIGKVEAWRLSRAMTALALRRLADPRWRLAVRVTPDGGITRAEPQGPGDLGERLRRAIRAHAGGPVAVVGTDAPDLILPPTSPGLSRRRGGRARRSGRRRMGGSGSWPCRRGGRGQ